VTTATKPRAKFAARQFFLRGVQQRGILMALIPNLPLDDEHPLEVVIREKAKVRGLDANALMWVGPLADIAAHAWVGGRKFSAEVWHEQFKREFLPEEDDHDLGELVKDPFTWRKWDWTPNGDRVLIGSTTQLTKRGFSLYLTQVEAFGAGLGVQFGARRMAA
jgi:hypothetical protein